MEDALWKLLGFLLSAVLLVVVPTQAMAERQEDMLLTIVQAETNRFTDTARDMGEITPALYDRFQERLQATGMHYDIHIRHERHVWQPVYNTTSEGLIFTGNYERASVSEGEAFILASLYPDAAGVSTRYPLHVGDHLQVEVRSRGDTIAASWRRLIGGSGEGMGIIARAGGMVRNEAP